MRKPRGNPAASEIRRHRTPLTTHWILALPLLAVSALMQSAIARDGPTVTVTMTADPQTYRGSCAAPIRITLTGRILVVGAAKGVSAQFRLGNGTPVGPVREAQLVRAGEYVVRDEFTRTTTWLDSVSLFVLTPVAAVSPKVVVTVTCDRGVVLPVAPPVTLPERQPTHPPTGEARFRVTATGFGVQHQTNESVFETYGAGDEVKLVSWGAEYTIGGGVRDLPIVRTLAYGDVDGTHDFSRVQAGRGNGHSNGGLMTGDSVPTAGAPVRRLSAEDVRSHTFPVVLWEGALRDGVAAPSNMVVLLPTLWELDGIPDADLMPQFGPWASAFVAGYGRATMHEEVAWGGTTWGPLSLVGNGMWANRWHAMIDFLGEFSRPIGMNGSFATAPGERLETGPESRWGVYFVPRPLRLTLGTATAAAAAGGVQMQFNDGSAYGGSYNLRMRVEALR
jgi:hypothetical protein